MKSVVPAEGASGSMRAALLASLLLLALQGVRQSFQSAQISGAGGAPAATTQLLLRGGGLEAGSALSIQPRGGPVRGWAGARGSRAVSSLRLNGGAPVVPKSGGGKKRSTQEGSRKSDKDGGGGSVPDSARTVAEKKATREVRLFLSSKRALLFSPGLRKAGGHLGWSTKFQLNPSHCTPSWRSDSSAIRPT